MNSFPEMPKRGVELPLGCNDLIDVEAIRNWTGNEHPGWPKRTLDQLGYMEGYLTRLLESAGNAAILSVRLMRAKAMLSP